MLDLQKIGPDQIVYDPFTGTGTTNVVCKQRGIKSIGVEAHPFVQNVALVKTTWDLDLRLLQDWAEELLFKSTFSGGGGKTEFMRVPELVRKCFSDENLRKLLHIREEIKNIADKHTRDFFSLALSCALRRASAAATGWPYIAPKKKIAEKDGVIAFQEQLNEMLHDLKTLPDRIRRTPSYILLADARNAAIESSSVDLAFTSPPYLNNYDYADRTRLEIYFNGFAATWGEITESVRKRLIVSATTQINRSEYVNAEIISSTLKEISPSISRLLETKVWQLGKIRNLKGGKKSYDIMVAQYFNDMTLALLDNHRVLKPGSCFMLILGDSAPYGIHIPTEEILGKIGLGIGFRDYSISKLRERGNKWKANPQRHHVLLKESLLTLKK